MRNSLLVTVLILMVGVTGGFAAGDKQTDVKAPSKPAVGASPGSVDKDIRATAEAFLSAFNKGDAKAIAALWTAQCEYVDEKGRVFRGRDVIEKEYAAFFAKNPGVRMDASISSITLIGNAAAIEEGATVVKSARKGFVSMGYYTAVQVKEGDKWLMASVREHAAPSRSVHATVNDLEWLIGEWTATKDSKTVEFSFRRIANKKYLELVYTVRDKDTVARSGVQIIGIDPSSGELVSWSFDSNGGRGRGTWRAFPHGWIIESLGMMSDGVRTVCTDIVSKNGKDGFTWQAVNRQIAGLTLPDTEAVVLTRKAP
jgi:uncharacterized protein (TIGR02246 family)